MSVCVSVYVCVCVSVYVYVKYWRNTFRQTVQYYIAYIDLKHIHPERQRSPYCTYNYYEINKAFLKLFHRFIYIIIWTHHKYII